MAADTKGRRATDAGVAFVSARKAPTRAGDAQRRIVSAWMTDTETPGMALSAFFAAKQRGSTSSAAAGETRTRLDRT